MFQIEVFILVKVITSNLVVMYSFLFVCLSVVVVFLVLISASQFFATEIQILRLQKLVQSFSRKKVLIS